MKTDSQLKNDVEHELEWDPAINAARVGVSTSGGIVTLTGHVQSYAEKFAIEKAVKRVAGVQGIAIELDVKLAPHHQRSDTEIAQAAESALRWNTLVPKDSVQLRVECGYVTLEGTVDWQFQRAEAERSVRHLTGVVSVSNLIALKPHATPGDVKRRIESALVRHAVREADRIQVAVNGSSVTLTGRVDSWDDRAAAQGAAWAAPGIDRVQNELHVGPPVKG